MQIKTPYAFTLDIVKPTKIPYMEFYKTDVNTSQMDISITNNDEAVDLTGHTLILNIKKADGTEIQNMATVEDAIKGLVNVSLTTQSLTALGECRVQLTVFSGETRKSTHEFKYYVKASLLNAEVPLSSNEYGLLLQLIDEVQTVENILNTSEATRITNEENRIILFNQLSTLKLELETLQGQLNSLEDNVEESEYAREYNEQQRQTLKGQLDTLKAELELLQIELNDLNSTVNSNEETRKSNEIQRQADELDRIELKGQLDSLKGSLQSLENTLNTNDATRTNTVNNKMYEVDNKVINYEAIITDIQNRFALLSSSVQQASEVINARTSTIRNKTFTDLNKRIEEVEKDILTQQSTQVTDNISYMNVLANSLDGATDVSIKGNTLVNLYPDNVEKVLPIPLSLVDKVDSVMHLGNTLEGNSEFNLKGQSLVNLLGNKGTSVFRQTGTPQTIRKFIGLNLQANKTYTFIVKVTNYSGASELYATMKNSTNNVNVPNAPTINTNGLYKWKFVPLENRDEVWWYFSSGTTGICDTSEIMILEGDYTTQEIPYFEGIGSVEGTTTIKSIGENLFDGLWNDGKHLSLGILTDSADRSTTNFITIKPNTDYSFKNDANNINQIAEYDSNGMYIRNLSGGVMTFKTSVNAKYLRFNAIISANQKNNCMFVQGTTPKTYSAYRTSSITVTDTLRSVSPTVYDEYLGSKKITKVGRVVLNGSEGWQDWGDINAGINRVFLLPQTDAQKGLTVKTLSDKFKWDTYNTTVDKGEYISNNFASASGNIVIVISKTKATDLATFKTWLSTNNVEVLYELATPTESTITPITLPIYTNGTLIVEPTKLFPKLSSQDTFDRTINLKPSTLYSIFINAKNTGTLEVDLGGIKGNITPTTSYTNNKVTITTPSTLTHSMLKLKGGNISTKDYMVIETDVVEPKYFSGIASVDSDVVVKSIGENLFDSTIIKDIAINTTSGAEVNILNSRVTGYITVKPSTIYTFSKSETWNNRNNFTQYDSNKNVISSNNYTFTDKVTITTSPNTRYIRYYYWQGQEGGVPPKDIPNNFMLNEGSVAKAYTPYKEDKLTLSEYLGDNFPLRSVGSVSDEYVGKKLIKRVKEYVLQASDITSVVTSFTGVDLFITNSNVLPNTIKLLDHVQNVTIIENMTEKANSSETYNDIKNVGNYAKQSVGDCLIFLLAKGTTLDQAKAQLTGKKILYQLATPQEIILDRPINLPIYKNGSIIVEPSKLYPKLSYTFPTNLGRSVESIVNNLSWVKENQQFIFAYMLDLETRLSIIEGGL